MHLAPVLAASCLALAATLAVTVTQDKPPEAPKSTAPARTVADLGWIAGAWVIEGEKGSTEEHWIQPGGGAMLGVSRTIRGEKMAFFEFLRIETRGGDLYYVAQPGGGQPTPFRLVNLEGKRATFENLKHDFPKRIVYALRADGGLDARIEGDGTEREKPQDFHFKPQKR